MSEEAVIEVQDLSAGYGETVLLEKLNFNVEMGSGCKNQKLTESSGVNRERNGTEHPNRI